MIQLFVDKRTNIYYKFLKGIWYFYCNGNWIKSYTARSPFSRVELIKNLVLIGNNFRLK